MNADQLESAFDDYLKSRQGDGLAATTIKSYRTYLHIARGVLRSRGCLRIADVTSDDLQAVMAYIQEEGRAKSSRTGIAIQLKSAFRWFMDNGRVIRDPALGLPLPDDGEDELLEMPLSEAEVRTLFAALPRTTWVDLRNVCLLELLYGCGLRHAEAINLDVRDIDQGREMLHVREGKGGVDRRVPIQATALAAVRDYLAARRHLLTGPDQGALFLTSAGTRLSQQGVYEFFKRLNDERGPHARHLHPHLFRHSIAVHMLRNRVDIRYIQHFLGHKDLESTKHYLRLVPGHLREVYDKAMPDIRINRS